MSTNPNPQRPASRYRSSREVITKTNWTGKLIAIAAVALIFAVVFAFARYMQAREAQTVSASMGAFERIDDHTFQMDVDVSRDNVDEPSYCIVTALDYSHGEVGRREVLVEPGGDSVIRITTTIPTRAPAVSGGIYGCSTTIPAHMNL
ncbi:DUF4307 domain-containing protein [Corynebacterium pacaense]|uniref:DUF4307 domain-containing protein n=1 Tax=Corynebacterium pacaense TaxID=1816684 RepID=UPI0009B94CD5|nr:DUF4307 domain-containing protein [Corynebacterium pacaense]